MSRAAVDEPVVNLVGNHGQVVPAREPSESVERVTRQDGAGGIRGIAQQQRLGARRDRGFDGCRVEREPARGASRHRNRCPAGQHDRRGMRRVGGVGDDHFVAGIDNRTGGEVEPFRDSCRDQELVLRVVAELITAFEVAADRFTQVEQAQIRRVVGLTLFNRADGGFADRPGRDEIGLADT